MDVSAIDISDTQLVLSVDESGASVITAHPTVALAKDLVAQQSLQQYLQKNASSTLIKHQQQMHSVETVATKSLQTNPLQTNPLQTNTRHTNPLPRPTTLSDAAVSLSNLPPPPTEATTEYLWRSVLQKLRSFICRVQGLATDHNYSPNVEDLFRKESETKKKKLIAKQHLVNEIWVMLTDFQELLDETGTVPADTTPKIVKKWMAHHQLLIDRAVQTDDKITQKNDKFVQISAGKREIERRINSFVKRKRLETDAFNQREFSNNDIEEPSAKLSCNNTTSNTAINRIDLTAKQPSQPPFTSCARTNACYVPRQSTKSLVKVKRVQNTGVAAPALSDSATGNSAASGITSPNRPSANAASKLKQSPSKLKTLPAIHPSATLPSIALAPHTRERLDNLQKHLYLDPNHRLKADDDVLQNIKQLEARVLYLETLSPEYFTLDSSNSSLKKGSTGAAGSINSRGIIKSENKSSVNSSGDGEQQDYDFSQNRHLQREMQKTQFIEDRIALLKKKLLDQKEKQN